MIVYLLCYGAKGNPVMSIHASECRVFSWSIICIGSVKYSGFASFGLPAAEVLALRSAMCLYSLKQQDLPLKSAAALWAVGCRYSLYKGREAFRDGNIVLSHKAGKFGYRDTPVPAAGDAIAVKKAIIEPYRNRARRNVADFRHIARCQNVISLCHKL